MAGESSVGPDWAAIDQVLGPDFRAYRDQCAALLGFNEPGDWRLLPMLVQLSTYVAVQMQAKAIQKAEQLKSWEGAVYEAAEHLGVNGDTHRRRLREWEARRIPPADSALAAPNTPR